MCYIVRAGKTVLSLPDEWWPVKMWSNSSFRQKIDEIEFGVDFWGTVKFMGQKLRAAGLKIVFLLYVELVSGKNPKF